MSNAGVSAEEWKRYLKWAEGYFLFHHSKRPLSSVVAFRFDRLDRTLLVRNKSNAVYTGASIRALLIRVADSREIDEQVDQGTSPELEFATCVLELYDDFDLESQWPEWKLSAKEIGCSSKWYSDILGWSDGDIKTEFGLSSMSGPAINVATLV
ncbi:adenyl-nucleotide exchange factor sse1 [Pestalotiopsis sp. IQ-011]